jgi:RimJ/RimL family protein N-acetyltransferase
MDETTIAIPEEISMVTDRLILRPLEDEDSKSLYENVKDYDIAKWTISIPHPYPKEGAISFIKQARKHLQSGLAYHLAILSRDNSELMGVMSLIGVNMRHRNAELGYWVGKDFWNKGIATEAALKMLEFGFQDLSLERISARCFQDNIPSIRVIEKIGMIYEGTFRKEILKEDRFIDMKYYAILKEEWSR